MERVREATAHGGAGERPKKGDSVGNAESPPVRALTLVGPTQSVPRRPWALARGRRSPPSARLTPRLHSGTHSGGGGGEEGW